MIYILILYFLLFLSLFKTNEKRNFIIGCCLIFFVFAFKSFKVGADTENYIKYFLNSDGAYSFYSQKSVDLESLNLYNKILRILVPNGTSYFLISYLIILLPFYGLISKYSRNKNLSLCFFFLFNCYMVYIVAFRQVLSLGFILWAYYIFDKRADHYKVLVPILLIAGISLHFSSIIVVSFYLLCQYFSWNKKMSIVLILSSALLGYVISKDESISNILLILSGYSDYFAKVEDYSQWISGSALSIFDYLKLALISSALIYCLNDEDAQSFFTKVFVIGTVFTLIFYNFQMLQRSVVGFIIMGTIIVPSAFVRNNKRNKFYYIPYIVLLYYIYVFTRDLLNYNLQENLSGILPYTFIFE